MTDDLVLVLARFHREVILPDVERLLGELERRIDGRFDQMNGRFDGVYHRLDRLDTEYHMITVGLRRVEDRLDRVERP